LRQVVELPKERPESHLMKQWIYRHEFMQPIHFCESPGGEFKLLSSPWDALSLWRPLFRCLGLPGAIKAGLKLATRKRKFYCVIAEGGVAHYGWLSFSFCRYYSVGNGDVVIGPINTSQRAQGCGYATFALKRAINELIARSFRVFWIDTADTNVPCQKVIQKCGFGKPVASFDRPVSGL